MWKWVGREREKRMKEENKIGRGRKEGRKEERKKERTMKERKEERKKER